MVTEVSTPDGTLLAKYDIEGVSIYFGQTQVIRFEKNGIILVEGVWVAQNRKAAYGLQQFLKNIESGNFVETERE